MVLSAKSGLRRFEDDLEGEEWVASPLQHQTIRESGNLSFAPPLANVCNIHESSYPPEALEASPLSSVRPTPSERGFLQRSPDRNIPFIFFADKQ